MKRCFCIWILAFLAIGARAQGPVTYRLRYTAPGDCCIHLLMVFSEPLTTPIALVMPRTYPGGYEQVPYDSFVENVRASSEAGKDVGVKRDTDGPRWTIGNRGESVERIEYQIDAARMESQILSSVQASKVRGGYVGLDLRPGGTRA